MIKSFRDLEVYKESYELAVIVNKEVLKLPDFERFDLVSQLRRASKSIPANIAEGYAKRVSSKEFLKHLTIALGSANEMEVHLELTKDLNYWGEAFSDELIDRYQVLGKKLNKLIKNWKTF
jgi:four helix bundle protein